jgi:hypothetical protein
MTEEVQTGAEAMSPGPEHKLLKSFLGTFRAEVQLWMGPGDPMVSTGTMTNIMVLDGRYLRQKYVGDASEGPFPNFKGHGFWGYNRIANRFEGYWIDNASTIMQFETGSVDESGKVWTMTSEMVDPQGGTMSKRSVITLKDDDHHSIESFFTKEGQEFKAMEIQYERAEG